MENRVLIQKVKIIVDTEDENLRKEQYKFLHDAQYSQYQALNKAMGYISSNFFMYGLKSDEYKEALKLSNSSPIFNDIDFGTGIDTKSSVTQKVKKDFKSALKNGLLRGERNITNYKRTFPLMTRGRDLKFSYDDKNNIIIKWVNKIKFKVILDPKKRNTINLKHILHKVVNGEYKVSQSSLAFNKKELILILSMNLGFDKDVSFVKDRTLGVDLGMAVPAYISISDRPYIRKGLGTYEECAKTRVQFKARRRRLQKQLSLSKGGKGRKDKLSALDNLRDKESNFNKTYNHYLSKNIVKFAKDNQCEFINLEKINSDTLKDRVLGLWTYYDLQQKIEYKADLLGIKVRYVKAAYT
ncbi:MAG: RNA-guided endonuclease TnpB family protein, partial [Sarcina sp.]